MTMLKTSCNDFIIYKINIISQKIINEHLNVIQHINIIDYTLFIIK